MRKTKKKKNKKGVLNCAPAGLAACAHMERALHTYMEHALHTYMEHALHTCAEHSSHTRVHSHNTAGVLTPSSAKVCRLRGQAEISLESSSLNVIPI